MRSPRRIAPGIALLACILRVGTAAQIDSTVADSPFRVNTGREAFLLGTGFGVGVTGLVLINNVDPLTPEEIQLLDADDINSFDRASIAAFRETAGGDLMMYASFLLPLTLLSHEQCRDDLSTLGIMWAEVLLLESGLNAVVKSAVQRTRPYVYDPDTPMEKKTSTDARLSFFSGHTGITAATSFYVASVFSAYRLPGTTKTLIWAGAAIYPALTGYLRRDSGHHFRSDVIAGYVIGGFIGWLIPALHRAGHDSGISLRPQVSPAGTGLRVIFALR